MRSAVCAPVRPEAIGTCEVRAKTLFRYAIDPSETSTVKPRMSQANIRPQYPSPADLGKSATGYMNATVWLRHESFRPKVTDHLRPLVRRKLADHMDKAFAFRFEN